MTTPPTEPEVDGAAVEPEPEPDDRAFATLEERARRRALRSGPNIDDLIFPVEAPPEPGPPRWARCSSCGSVRALVARPRCPVCGAEAAP